VLSGKHVQQLVKKKTLCRRQFSLPATITPDKCCISIDKRLGMKNCELQKEQVKPVSIGNTAVQPVAAADKSCLETVVECDNVDESSVSSTPLDLVFDSVLDGKNESNQKEPAVVVSSDYIG
jgi:hypothetical protein